MQKIKVLHIIKSLGRGGAEMLLPETLNIHDKEKFEFHYIYFLPWKDQMVRDIEKNGGKVTCLSSKNNFELLGKAGQILKYCKAHKIDLIHCHLPWAGFVGRIVFFKSKIPVVYTEHNMQERYHKITKVINNYSFNYQTLAIGVSNDVSNSIKSNINPKIPVKTLLNGVNTKKFIRRGESDVRRELNIPEDAIVIGNVAVFRFQKRIKEWLNVFHELSKQHSNLYGIIVGAGPLENEINEELERLNLQNRVFLPGLIEEVRPYFEAMNIFMMSSSFEGLPIALLEAMSMECAVVSTDAGGIKEVIRQDVDGLICKSDEWKNLVPLVGKLLEDSKKLEGLGKASRKRVLDKFSLKVMVHQLELYYNQLALKK
jgi:L-malate glycosyltransferase